MMEEQAFQLKTERKEFSRVGLIYFAALGAAILAQFVFSWIILHFQIELDQAVLSTLLSVGSTYVIGLGVCLLLNYVLPAPERHILEKRRLGASVFFTSLIISYGLLFAGNMIGQGLMWGFDTLMGIPYENPVSDSILDTPMWQVLLVVVLIGPIAEEFMCRKLLIDRLCRYGEATAIVISAMIFALFHGNFFQFFYAFGTGLVFGYLYVKSGYLRYSILLHMIINFMGSALPLLLLSGLDTDAIASGTASFDLVAFSRIMLTGIYDLVILGAAIAGIVILICVRKRITFNQGECILPKGMRFRTIFLNLGMILFILLCVVIFSVQIFI